MGFTHGPGAGVLGIEAAPLVSPDFFKILTGREGPDSGIIVEVERGRARDGNMDLLDLWKAHVSPLAHFLFLVLPREVHNTDPPHLQVGYSLLRRVGSFFADGVPQLDVDQVHVFIY